VQTSDKADHTCTYRYCHFTMLNTSKQAVVPGITNLARGNADHWSVFRIVFTFARCRYARAICRILRFPTQYWFSAVFVPVISCFRPIGLVWPKSNGRTWSVSRCRRILKVSWR